MKINSENISVVNALADLKNSGYNIEFRRDPACLYSTESHRWIASEQFSVDESYHFEVTSSPDADRIVYAISCRDGIKGILVEALGVYADNMSMEMAQKLSFVRGTDYQTLKLKFYEYENIRITHRRFGRP